MPCAPKTVVIATCQNYPYAQAADAPLLAGLKQTGCHAQRVPWDCPDVAWHEFDACIVRSTWDWHLRPQAFAHWITRVSASTTLVNDSDLMAWGLDKRYLLELGRAGVPIVPTLTIPRDLRHDIPAIARAKRWPRVVVKPALGASSYRAGVVDLESSDLHSWTDANRDWDGVALMQPFLPSIQERGETSVVCIGSELTHAVRKVPKAGDFRVQSEFGGSEQVVPISPEERAIANRCLSALPSIPAYARIDLVRGADNQVMVIECEVVEPTLYFELCPNAAQKLAELVVSAIPGRHSPTLRGSRSSCP